MARCKLAMASALHVFQLMRSDCVWCAFLEIRWTEVTEMFLLTRNTENHTVTTYSCTYCAFQSSNGIEFTKHFFQAHALEPTFAMLVEFHLAVMFLQQVAVLKIFVATVQKNITTGNMILALQLVWILT